MTELNVERQLDINAGNWSEREMNLRGSTLAQKDKWTEIHRRRGLR